MLTTPRSYVTEYGPNKERFKFTLFAVLAQSVMGALVARLGELNIDHYHI